MENPLQKARAVTHVKSSEYIVKNREFHKKGRGLKRPADTQFRDLMGFSLGDVPTFERDAAARCREKAAHHIEESRFSCPVGPDEPEYLPLIYGHIQIIDRSQAAEVF